MSQAGSLGSTFDLNSQSGVMAVLLAVRQSTLSPAQKSEVRDLVFLYSNGGGDVTVRRALEQKIATYGLAPVTAVPKAAIEAKPPPTPSRPYGTTRPAPQFAPVVTPPAPVSPIVIPAPVSAPVPPLPEPVVPPTPITAPEPVVAPAPVPPPVSPVVAPPATPVAPAPSVVTAAVPAASAVEVALARIRDIKAAVNQKVGNPVNLVDIDNTVGREYMVAMLEAMKRVAGNTPGDLGDAMTRLETAYAAVEAAIAAHGAPVSVPPSPVTPTPTMVVPPPIVPAPEVLPVLEQQPQPEPVREPEPVPVPALAPAPEAPIVEPRAPVAVPVSAPAPEVVPPRFAAMDHEPASAGVAAPVFRAASLAEDPVHLRTPQDLPDPASLATSSVTGDPLFTNEVDSGLEQLLSEWVIFKKSGLFGTGPRGREHPLFKTLASLTIPIILAGRYDGATPEIRQSITDYMNGWRYEQGIIYEQDETFEHYLRRVIHHIIDLQKRQRQA